MPGHVRWMPARIRSWFLDSPPLTRREFYALFSILFILITVALAGLVDQVRKGRARDRAVQTSRLTSCQTTYSSIEDVALFFFPKPELRDARQRRIAKHLDEFIGERIARCRVQVKTTTTKTTTTKTTTKGSP